MSETIFHRIIAGDIPAKRVYEDETCIAIEDIEPQAPTHILLIPKEDLAQLSHASAEQSDMLGVLLTKATMIMRDILKIDDYRVVINNGAGAGQSVFQLHLHLLAGRTFSWPPG